MDIGLGNGIALGALAWSLVQAYSKMMEAKASVAAKAEHGEKAAEQTTALDKHTAVLVERIDAIKGQISNVTEVASKAHDLARGHDSRMDAFEDALLRVERQNADALTQIGVGMQGVARAIDRMADVSSLEPRIARIEGQLSIRRLSPLGRDPIDTPPPATGR